jgi:hypothetical protein
MLRWVLGDSTFFRGIKQYMSDPKLVYGFARTDDLERNLEQVSGKNLSEFFKDWFTGQGYPSYTVKWSQNNNNWAKINLSQITSHPSVSFFEMPLALKFKNSSREKIVVVNNVKNNEISWEDIGFKADTVLIDPEYWVLSKNNISIKENYTSAGYNELKIYPVPATTEITVELKNPAEKNLSLHIYSMSGQLISSRQISTPGRDELFQINISHLPPGVYLFRFSAGNFKSTSRIIKI